MNVLAEYLSELVRAQLENNKPASIPENVAVNLKKFLNDYNETKKQ